MTLLGVEESNVIRSLFKVKQSCPKRGNTGVGLWAATTPFRVPLSGIVVKIIKIAVVVLNY